MSTYRTAAILLTLALLATGLAASTGGSGRSAGVATGPPVSLSATDFSPSGDWDSLSSEASYVQRANASAAAVLLPEPAILEFGGNGTYCRTSASPYCNDTNAYLLTEQTFDSWVNFAGPLAPSPREFAAMAFDPVENQTVLFGGYNGSVLGGTWIYSQASGWFQDTRQPQPPARYDASFAYDPADQTLLLFGGYGSNGPLGDTWSYSDGTWTELTPTLAPSPRGGAALAWDASTGRLWLFGGEGAHGLLGDTWGFHDGSWFPWTASTLEPPARANASMASTATSSPLLFGGDGAQGDLNDTWTFHDGEWSPLTFPSSLPPPRSGAALEPSPDLGPGYYLLWGGAMGSELYQDSWDLYVPFETLTNATAPLSVTISPSALSGRAPATLTFSAEVSGGAGPYVFAWSVTGRTPPPDGSRQVIAFQQPGSFHVSVNVTDASGQVAGATVRVVISEGPPTPVDYWGILGGPWVWGLVGALAFVTAVGLRSVGGRLGQRRSFYARAHQRAPASTLERLGGALVELGRTGDLGHWVRASARALGWSPAQLRARPARPWSPLTLWAVRRLLLLVPQVLSATALVYLLGTVAPGLAKSSSSALTAPALLTGWLGFTGNLFTGRWGFVDNACNGVCTLLPVSTYLGYYLPSTLELALISLALSTLLAYPLGLLSGWHRDRPLDQGTRTLTNLGLFFPIFVVGLTLLGAITAGFLQVFGDAPGGTLPSPTWFETYQGSIPSWIGYFGQSTPTGFPLVDAAYNGDWSAEGIILAKVLLQAAVITLLYSAIFLRYARELTGEAGRQMHIHAARARGISERKLLWTHTAREVRAKYVYVFGTTFSLFVFILLTVEWTFDATGVGSLFLTSFAQGHLNVAGSGATPSLIEVLTFLVLTGVLAVNVVAEIVSRALDPRLSEPAP